jgi:hypothetical protein
VPSTYVNIVFHELATDCLYVDGLLVDLDAPPRIVLPLLRHDLARAVDALALLGGDPGGPSVVRRAWMANRRRRTSQPHTLSHSPGTECRRCISLFRSSFRRMVHSN